MKKIALVAIACGVVGLCLVGVARAEVPDPLNQPVESISLVTKLWKSGTMPAALIVTLFLALTAASRKVKWLQRGYAAVVTASLLGGCSMLIERAASGTTPTASMFVSALVATVALALKPKAEPAKAE